MPCSSLARSLQGYHHHDYSALNSTSGVTQAIAGKPLLFSVKLTATPKKLTFEYSIDGVAVATFVEADAVRISEVAGSAIALRGFDGDASFHALSFQAFSNGI